MGGLAPVYFGSLDHFNHYIHSPPTQHPPNTYALKPVPSSQTSIRSTHYQAVEIIYTAALVLQFLNGPTVKSAVFCPDFGRHLKSFLSISGYLMSTPRALTNESSTSSGVTPEPHYIPDLLEASTLTRAMSSPLNNNQVSSCALVVLSRIRS